MKPHFFMVVLLAIAGCGGGGSKATADAGGDGGTGCTITLSGTLTASMPCQASASYVASGDTATLGFMAVPVPAGYDSLIASFTAQGDVQLQSYTGIQLSGGVGIHVGDGRVFQALVGTSSFGTVNKFQIDQKTPLSNDGTTQFYAVHGSFQATLAGVDPAGNPGGGNVMMAVVF